jgi:glycosyltransferase 2 family protein
VPGQTLETAASKARRARIAFSLKALLAAVLIAWLVRSGNLDLAALRIFVDKPALLVTDLLLFAAGMVIASLRFRFLLRIAGVRVPMQLLLRLQLTAAFFNVVIPGNIGGDFVKALYVARDQPIEKRTTIVLLAFVERLLGVTALVLTGAIVSVVRAPMLMTDPLLRPLAVAVTIVGAGTLGGGIVALLVVRSAGARLDRFTQGSSRVAKLANQLVASMRIVSEGPREIVIAIALSMAFHVLAIVFFTVVTRAILETAVPYTSVATLYPLGILTLLLPVSPSGLGVGHVAFKRLFEAIGLAGGATVFNVYLLGQIVPCLIGVIPFLTLRKELPTGE